MRRALSPVTLAIAALVFICVALLAFFSWRFDTMRADSAENRARAVSSVTASALGPYVDLFNRPRMQAFLEGVVGAGDVEYAVVQGLDGQVEVSVHEASAPLGALSLPSDGEVVLTWQGGVLHATVPTFGRNGARNALLTMGFDTRGLQVEQRVGLAVLAIASALVVLGGVLVARVVDALVERRRVAEEARRRSDAEFRALIEALPDAILVEVRGRVVYANPAANRYLDYGSAGAIEGHSLEAVFALDESSRAALDSARANVGGAPVYMPDARLRTRAGVMLQAEVVALGARFEDASATVIAARDLSERYAIQARLVRADRMASMGTLAAGVAHEINNPMAYVTTNITFALDELQGAAVGDPRPVRMALSEALEGAERVRRIVRDLKTYSQPDKNRLVSVDVERVVDAAVNLTRTEVRQRAQLVRDTRKVPNVVADESRLVQVLVNLLTNGAQAVPPGAAGSNTITLRTHVEADGRVALEVTDTGSGIAPEHLDRIFEPFFTTKGPGEGTGLGLSISFGIVKSFGGEIQVERRAEGGSAFRVLLPSAVAVGEAVTPAAPVITPAPGRRLRVLVLDDEPTIVESIARLLAREFDLATEVDAGAALERLRADARFDVVLCDLMMPGMTGIDFFQRLQEEIPTLAVRVVFLTGGAFTPAAKSFLERSERPVVEKPFEADTLRASIYRQAARTRASAAS
ncbi:MAG: ATP-binding protein [Bradymonadia bacterium]